MLSRFKTSVFFYNFCICHHLLVSLQHRPIYQQWQWTQPAVRVCPFSISQVVQVVRPSPAALLQPLRPLQCQWPLFLLLVLTLRLSRIQLRVIRALRLLLRFVLVYVRAFPFGMCARWQVLLSYNYGCHTQSCPLGCLWLHFQTLLIGCYFKPKGGCLQDRPRGHVFLVA